MLHTIFFYKHTKTLEELLIKWNRCNKYQKVFFIEPVKIYYMNYGFCKCNKFVYIFEPNTLYIAIEYLNYQIDPLFKEIFFSIKAECFKINFIVNQLHQVSPCYMYIDILLPFMPTNKILEKMKVFMVSSQLIEHGSYKITFRKKYNGNVEDLLRNLHTDFKKHLSNVPIFITAFYSVNWFC